MNDEAGQPLPVARTGPGWRRRAGGRSSRPADRARAGCQRRGSARRLRGRRPAPGRDSRRRSGGRKRRFCIKAFSMLAGRCRGGQPRRNRDSAMESKSASQARAVVEADTLQKGNTRGTARKRGEFWGCQPCTTVALPQPNSSTGSSR